MKQKYVASMLTFTLKMKVGKTEPDVIKRGSHGPHYQHTRVEVLVSEPFITIGRLLVCRARGPGFKPQQRQNNVSVTSWHPHWGLGLNMRDIDPQVLVLWKSRGRLLTRRRQYGITPTSSG